MENKINIAEILRDCPKGTKLYSPLFGKCELVGVDTGEGVEPIRVEPFCGGVSRTFSSKGCYFERYQDADCVLFPSDKMRCWSKFFKRGDVVYNPNSKMLAIFDGWASDYYTEFNTTINYYDDHTFGEEEVCTTDCFVKATDKQRVEFIEAAEKHYGGKYNPETLQVEPVKFVEPKCSFKPFDKVLVRDDGYGVWRVAHFSHYDSKREYPYVTTACGYKQCVSYEGNEYLLGTNKSPK